MRDEIASLWQRARGGDLGAIRELRDIALEASRSLRDLTDLDPDLELPESERPGVEGVREVMAESKSWPIDLNPFTESRPFLNCRLDRLDIGNALPFKHKGGRGGRFLHPNSQSGFAFYVFNHLEEVREDPRPHLHLSHLHPELAAPGVLTDEQMAKTWQNLAAELPQIENDRAVIDQWVEAGVEFCRDLSGGDWKSARWPDCVRAKEGRDPSGDGTLRTMESAIREKIKEGLKSLLR